MNIHFPAGKSALNLGSLPSLKGSKDFAPKSHEILQTFAKKVCKIRRLCEAIVTIEAICFQQITFKLDIFTNFEAFFLPALTDIR